MTRPEKIVAANRRAQFRKLLQLRRDNPARFEALKEHSPRRLRERKQFLTTWAWMCDQAEIEAIKARWK